MTDRRLPWQSGNSNLHLPGPNPSFYHTDWQYGGENVKGKWWLMEKRLPCGCSLANMHASAFITAMDAIQIALNVSEGDSVGGCKMMKGLLEEDGETAEKPTEFFSL